MRLIRSDRLREFAQALRDGPTQEALLPLMLDTAIEFIGAERGFLIAVGPTPAETDDSPRDLQIEAGRGFDGATLGEASGFSQTVIERVLERRRGLVTSSIADRDVKDRTSVQIRRVRSILCVPLWEEGKIQRVLYLDHRFDEDAFSLEDLSYMAGFAEHAAQALEATARFSRTGSAAEGWLGIFEESLEALANMVGAKPAAATRTTARPRPALGSGEKAKILIVDDHPVVREGLSLVFNSQPDLTVCAAVESVPLALQEIQRNPPDLALVDLSLIGSSGLDLVKSIKARWPELPCLVLSMHPEALYAERCLRAGAMGFVSKKEPVAKLMQAIRDVLAGELSVSAEVARRVMGSALGTNRSKEAGSPFDRLSDRELQVFELTGRGLTTREIARELKLSVKTIETYRAHIKKKLSLKDGTELLHRAISWAREQGIS